MVLIFGGVYQGKLNYALESFNATQNDVGQCTDESIDLPQGKKIIYSIDKWILALIKSDRDIKSEIQNFIKNNQEAIVICNDISCGVVPTDPIYRKWRDEVGRAMGVLAQNSTQVIRLYCGIATRLK